MARAVAVVAAAAALAVASAAPGVLFAAEPALVAPWMERGDAAATDAVHLQLGVKRANMGRVERIALEVSNPQHPSYTNYLTGSQIADITRNEEAITAVTAWLSAAGVPHHVAKTGAVVDIRTDAATAGALLSTTYRVVHNKETAQSALRAGDVTVPTEVSAHLEGVFGAHDLPLPPRDAPRDAPNDDGGGSPTDVTPSIINQAYGVSGQGSGNMNNRQAVAEFQGQLLNTTDLAQFFKAYVPMAGPKDHKVYKFEGDSQQGEGVEANLDIQYIMGVAPGILTEAWQYAGMGFCSDLKQWTTAILSATNPPVVFSVSYGWQGQMTQIGCSSSQISSIDDDFKSIAAAGVGIIFASGDSGSGSAQQGGNTCYASWPASSAWVTAVGSTRFEHQQAGNPEMATDQFGSGGGFSALITPAPAFQSSAIASFYQNEPASQLPPANLYGKGGRGTPDVAALGEGFQVIERGSPISVGGTSAATPTFSGLVSLVNDARMKKGKKALGNLNQFIYQNADVFTDIVKGSDRIGRGGQQLQYGFDAVKGWDPVSGFGTMKFKAFMAAALDA